MYQAGFRSECNCAQWYGNCKEEEKEKVEGKYESDNTEIWGNLYHLGMLDCQNL